MWSLRSMMALVLVFAGIAGCTVPDPKDIAARMRILELKPGMTRGEVERRVQSRPLHQFTCMHDDDEMVCTSHWFPGLPRMYLLYRDGALEKIMPAIRWRGDAADAADNERHQPQARIDRVIAHASMSHEEIEGFLAQARAGDEIAKACAEPGALYLAVILTAPLQPLAWPREIAARSRYQRLAGRYNAFKAQAGMTVAHVDAIYGQPDKTLLTNDLETRVYGEFAEIEGFADYAFAWVAVQFRDGRAVAVLSHDFLTEAMLRTEGRQTYLDQD